jgi:predicted nucleic acid-binding protein
MLIETDVLLAALNPADPANPSARKVLDQEGLLLSPYSLLEVNLLARSEKLLIRDYDAFAGDLGALLDACSVQTLSDRAEYHSSARRLETRFKLTFFDSLHAAVSKLQKEMLVSFDRAYDRLSNEGVRRIDPRDI